MTDHTQTQAALLSALADHLANHPSLPPVNILGDDSLHVRDWTNPARNLSEWAATLDGVKHVTIHAIYSDDEDDYRAFCYVVGHVKERRVSVWDVVPALLDALGGIEALDTERSGAITVDSLAAFAADEAAAPVLLGDLTAA